jgi:hypothetical protein
MFPNVSIAKTRFQNSKTDLRTPWFARRAAVGSAGRVENANPESRDSPMCDCTPAVLASQAPE